MNLDNFSPEDAFIYDSWSRGNNQEDHQESNANTNVTKLIDKYVKDKDKIDMAHDKVLINLPEMFKILHAEKDHLLHNEFELLKHRCKLYLEKVSEYEFWAEEGQLNTTAEDRANWQQTMHYIDMERTDLHNKLIGQYNKIVNILNKTPENNFSLMDIKSDRKIVRFWAKDIIKQIEKDENTSK